MIGWKEADDRVAGKTDNSQETADDGCGCAFVGRLHYEPRRFDLRKFIGIKPLVGFHDRKQCSLWRYSVSKSGAGLSEERPSPVQRAKLLWPFFARD